MDNNMIFSVVIKNHIINNLIFPIPKSKFTYWNNVIASYQTR